MKRTRVYRKRFNQHLSLSDIEADLQAAFRPVDPRPSFVHESRVRLVKASQQKRSKLMTFRITILILAGMVSSLLILVLSVRATLTLLGTLGMLLLVREQSRQKRLVTAAS